MSAQIKRCACETGHSTRPATMAKLNRADGAIQETRMHPPGGKPSLAIHWLFATMGFRFALRPDGEIGIRTGLKIPWGETPVRVRAPLRPLAAQGLTTNGRESFFSWPICFGHESATLSDLYGLCIGSLQILRHIAFSVGRQAAFGGRMRRDGKSESGPVWLACNLIRSQGAIECDSDSAGFPTSGRSRPQTKKKHKRLWPEFGIRFA